MPKAGIEPARGQAPLDFESSASSSSATSARGFTLGERLAAQGLNGSSSAAIIAEPKAGQLRTEGGHQDSDRLRTDVRALVERRTVDCQRK
jgi:hypothetical protein